ncbi:MAG: SDR family oxidoreductase [Pseudomonadota bacterium]
MWSEHLPAGRRIEILEGEPFHIDFGLRGDEWNRLQEEVEIVYHFFPVSNDREAVRKALVETVELCETAPRFRHLVLLSLFSVRDESVRSSRPEPSNSFGAPSSPWARSGIIAEKMLHNRRGAIPWTILRHGVPAAVSPTFMPGKPTSIIDRVLQILVILQCQVDIKTLKKISSRHMSFTPVETLAEAAALLPDKPHMAGETLNFYFDGTCDIHFLRQIIGSVLNDQKVVNEGFTTKCRKAAEKLIERRCGDLTPLRLLGYCTTQGHSKCEKTVSFIEECGLAVPQIQSFLVQSIKANVKNIEEEIKSIESEMEITDSLE